MGLKSYGESDQSNETQLTAIEIESILRTLKDSKVMGFSVQDIEPLYHAINKLKSQREHLIQERNTNQ